MRESAFDIRSQRRQSLAASIGRGDRFLQFRVAYQETAQHLHGKVPHSCGARSTQQCTGLVEGQ